MGINQGLYTSTTDLWETPQDFFDGLDTEFCFELDVCALPENAKCDKRLTPPPPDLFGAMGAIFRAIAFTAEK